MTDLLTRLEACGYTGSAINLPRMIADARADRLIQARESGATWVVSPLFSAAEVMHAASGLWLQIPISSDEPLRKQQVAQAMQLIAARAEELKKETIDATSKRHNLNTPNKRVSYDN